MLGPHIGLDPEWVNFSLGTPTCRYIKTLKFVLPPTPTPNANMWDKGCVASPAQNSRIGHVYFNSFMSISFALGPIFQWNMGLILAMNTLAIGCSKANILIKILNDIM